MTELLTIDLPVKYHKSTQFRVVYAEGCFGGVSNRGLIRCSFWNERSSLPTEGMLHIVDGLPLTEDVVAGGEGLAREVEAEIVMDLNAAVAFHGWFSHKLEALRKGLGVPDDKWEQMKQASQAK